MAHAGHLTGPDTTQLQEYALALALDYRNTRQQDQIASAVKALQSFIDPAGYKETYKEENQDDTNNVETVDTGLTMRAPETLDDLDQLIEDLNRAQKTFHGKTYNGGSDITIDL